MVYKEFIKYQWIGNCYTGAIRKLICCPIFKGSKNEEEGDSVAIEHNHYFWFVFCFIIDLWESVRILTNLPQQKAHMNYPSVSLIEEF